MKTDHKKGDAIMPLPISIVVRVLITPGQYVATTITNWLGTVWFTGSTRMFSSASTFYRGLLLAFIFASIFAVVTLAVFAAIATVVIVVLSVWPSEVLSISSHPAFIVPAILLALFLYSLRSSFLAAYAVIEMLVGIVAIWFAVLATTDSLLVKGMGLMGGIYILVRGFDNLEKSIPNSGTFRNVWDRNLRGREDPKK